MSELREIERDNLAIGKVEAQELERIRQSVFAGGKINRPEADFLVELHKRVEHVTPAFEQFFYQAIKEHLLADGWIDADETFWVRQMLLAGGKIDGEERKFLQELRSEARHVSHEFEVLFNRCMKEPLE